MSESFKFDRRDPSRPDYCVLSGTEAASVPQNLAHAESAGRVALLAVPKVMEAGIDGVPGIVPRAVPSTNVQQPFAR